MHMRLWAAEGFLGSAVALMLTYLLVEPESLMSGYGRNRVEHDHGVSDTYAPRILDQE